MFLLFFVIFLVWRPEINQNCKISPQKIKGDNFRFGSVGTDFFTIVNFYEIILVLNLHRDMKRYLNLNNMYLSKSNKFQFQFLTFSNMKE